MRAICGLALLLLLGACGANWSKSNTTPQQAAHDLSECRHDAEIANRRDSNIDTDIIASRGQDWQRLEVLRTKQSDYAESNRRRTGDIVDQCMFAKGYTIGK